ncbi:hemerythrin domain-containing protein [Archangium sp.]|uniref:hemerythrin domain-containing protein n=1 Tax=Archangium sp. TaxID=1872627 RepID=UPI002EDAD071
MYLPLPSSTAAASRRRDAFQLLLESHGRIRFFIERAVRVARLSDIPAGEREEAITRVERYFTVGLPLHEEEELLLAHRLRAARPSTRSLDALEWMSRQHRDIEALLESLLPRWRLLRESPERHAELATELMRDTLRFADLMEAHLRLEECVIFPEARTVLSVASVTALGTEMRTRRGLRP